MIHQAYINCDLCEKPYEYSHGKYTAIKCKTWDMMFCRGCRNANEDGIVLATWPKFKTKLENMGISYVLN